MPDVSVVTPDGRPGVDGPAEGRLRLRLQVLARHPYLTVGVAALVVRVAIAVVTSQSSGWTIPDEQQYVELARTVASGSPASRWDPSYGQFLYETTWIYTGVVRFLFDIFGAHRVVAQLYPAVTGTVVAVATAWLARRLVSAPFAVLAGLIVGLLPSQALWSSVALRESSVWLVAIGMAVVCALALERSRTALLPLAVSAAGLIWAMHHLRNQTLIAMVWALAVAGLVGARHRGWRVAGTAALVLYVPVLLGLGVGGYAYVKYGVSGLDYRRTVLAVGADSAVTELEHATTTTAPAAGTTPPPPPPPPGDYPDLVSDGNGGAYVVGQGLGPTVRHVPRGFSAFLVRPFPWERTHSIGITTARVENLLWLPLYVLAAMGAWASRRRAVAAYPVVFAVLIIGIASVSQGNIGTAFRHRGQILWVFAMFAVVPIEQWWARRSTARSSSA